MNGEQLDEFSDEEPTVRIPHLAMREVVSHYGYGTHDYEEDIATSERPTRREISESR